MKKRNFRPLIQTLAALATNANLGGFFTGKIYQGGAKYACVPGLNCYSCPGAVGACPIGSLQAVLGARKHWFSFYVFGILIFFGMLLGRAVCGFLCLFGFIQELLYKIPLPKLKVPEKVDRPLRWLKYAVLIALVLLLPMFATNQFGVGAPYFCKFLCPAGTLEGGIPMVLANGSLRAGLGAQFWWKIGVLVLVVLSSVVIYRPFCKYLCPLGAFYSFFNKLSLLRMDVDREKCVGCGKCGRVCGMNVRVPEDINSPECIRCGACRRACPTKAISVRFGLTEAPRRAGAKKVQQSADIDR